jgi:hypothetical protein
MAEQKFADWGKWLDNLWKEIYELHRQSNMFIGLWSFVNANPRRFAHTYFKDWLAKTYWASSSLTIRRLMDKDNRNYSLLQLLQDIKVFHAIVSLDRLKKLYLRGVRQNDNVAKRIEEKEATRDFRRYEKKGDFLNPFSVERDIQNINEVTKPLVRAVNTYLAHNSRIKKSNVPGLARTKDCLTLFRSIYKKYHLLILGRVAFTDFPKSVARKEVNTIFKNN